MILCNYDTAVVILSYNGKKWHDLFLPKIIEQAKDQYQVIVVDNASTDDTLLHVQTHYPSVTTLHLPVNRGFANGYYEALQQIAATYYILLSADFEVTDNWFSHIHDKMLSDPQIAVCQPKIRYWKERSYFEYAGAAGGFIDFLGYPFCRGRIFDTIEKDYGQYEKETEIFWASGAALFIKKDAWLEADGFDESLFAHMEEIDLCWRLKRLGKQIWYCPAASVYHVGGGTLSAESPHKTFLNFRNNLLMLYKNLPKNKRIYIIGLRFFLDFMSLIRFLVDKKSSNAWAISRAHVDFLKRVWKKEANGLELDGTFNALGLFPRSIVWQYFVRKQKTYKQL